jgi:hypothetical protein
MKAKNPLLLSLVFLPLMLLLAACGTTAVISTTAVVSIATTISTTTTPNPFKEAVHATPGPPPESVDTVVVEMGSESWVLPAAVCLRADGDADIVLAAAQRQVAIVHSLVAPMISGWPTTTVTEEELANRERDLPMAGVIALTLAGLVGQQTALEQAWVDYEQSFADPGQGWGPPDQISSRVEGWKAEAQALTQAIASRCSAE